MLNKTISDIACPPIFAWREADPSAILFFGLLARENSRGAIEERDLNMAKQSIMFSNSA